MCQKRSCASHFPRNYYRWWWSATYSSCQHACFLLFLLTLFGLIFQGSDGVKDVQLEGPRYARRGEDLMLRCNYDLETDSLYAVKWYRGSEEFYRFLPKESPPKQAFPIHGVVVDVNKSDDHSVFLRNISFETNGRFKCVISAEGTFQTLENVKDIDVIVIDYNSPKLYLDKMSYQPGDRGLANCSIERTFPAPNITWFINGKAVNFSVVTKVKGVSEDRSFITKNPSSSSRSGGGGRGRGMATSRPVSAITTSTNQGASSSSGSGTFFVTVTTISNSSASGASSPSFYSSSPAFFSSSTESASTERSQQSGYYERKSRKPGGGGGGGGTSTGGASSKSKLTSSVSTLSFPIQSYSPLTIKCTGQLYDVYNETSSIQIQPKAPLLYPYPTMNTPKSQHKYGLPDQLQTYNSSANGGHALAVRRVLFVAAAATAVASVTLFSQTAQFIPLQ